LSMSSLRTRASNSNFAFAVLRKEVFAVRVFSFFRCDVDCLGFLYVCLSSFGGRWSKINFENSRATTAIPA
jgi:hypothetical protein